jgi:TolA-binding protein
MYEPAIWGRSGENVLSIVPESGVAGRPLTPEGITPDEIYGLAVRDYAEKRYEKARAALARLVADFALLDKYQEECQAMLMRSNFALRDARRAVTAYERLVTLNPRRGPRTTEERRQLADGYQEIGEHERALALYRGVADEYFAREMEVAETYRSLRNPYHAQDFTKGLLRTYPDSNLLVERAYGLALGFMELKVRASESEAESAKIPGVSTGLMLPEALESLLAFLSHYPESSLADDAHRMAVTLLNRMERFEEAVSEARKFLTRYERSVHLDDVLYYLTESYYEQGEYGKVFETGGEILERKFRLRPGSRKTGASPFVPHVRYLFAKIHHLKGELKKAVDLYRKVSSRFTDAGDALTFLTREELVLPESAEFGPGTKPVLSIRRKNLESVSLRIYPVDLMLLIAVRKDLRKANSIDLTGIATENQVELAFDSGKDYRWHEESVPLSIEKKGVYLVVARAEGMVKTSIVLVSDLVLSVQPVGDRVRVYATDRRTGAPVSGAFVKVSDGKAIRAQGFTDARGIFEGKVGRGPVMVVAEKEGDFALYRR